CVRATRPSPELVKWVVAHPRIAVSLDGLRPLAEQADGLVADRGIVGRARDARPAAQPLAEHRAAVDAAPAAEGRAGRRQSRLLAEAVQDVVVAHRHVVVTPGGKLLLPAGRPQRDAAVVERLDLRARRGRPPAHAPAGPA